MKKRLVVGWLIAGTLDLVLAIALTLIRGGNVASMLRFVASGPFPPATEWGAWGAALGVAVHFALMGIMAGVYGLVWWRFCRVRRRAVISGLAYGLITYVVLDLIIVPLRFPAAWPPKPLSIATQMFAHLILVGLVFALSLSFFQSNGTAGTARRHRFKVRNGPEPNRL